MEKLFDSLSSAFASSDGDTLLVNILLQTTLLALLALLACLACKRHASARYNVLFSAMLGLVLTSAVSIWMQSNGNAFVQFEFPDQTRLQGIIPALDLTVSNENLIALDTDMASAGSSAVSASSSTSEPKSIFPSMPLMLGITWLAGFAFSFLGLMRSLHQIGRIADSSRVPTPEEKLELAAASGNSIENTHIRITSSVASPVLAGLVSPVLLIPNRLLATLSKAQLQEILIHELAHVKRNDCLANFIQKLVLCVFWFHPLVYLIDRELSKAREEVCDNYVLQQTPALNYSETLLAVTSMCHRVQNTYQAKRLNLGIISLQWKLEDRIRELLDNSRSQTVKLSTQSQSVLLLTFISLSVFISGCQLQAAEQTTPENQSGDSSTELQRRNVDLEAALIRERFARSLTEMLSMLDMAESEIERRDLTELMRRIFADMENRLADNSQEILGEAAGELLTALARSLDNSQDDREELKRSLTRLQSALDLGIPNPPQIMRDRPRSSAPVNSLRSLNETTLQVVTAVQELMHPTENGVAPDLHLAKQQLDEHRSEFWDSLTDYEKSTLLNFYTNYWLTLEDYSEAINTFEEMLTIENLESSTRLRTLRSLGQLYMAEEQWEQAISRYQEWREQSEEEDTVVFRGLSYSNYQLDRFADALPYWQQYMTLASETGDALDRNDYAYLNGLFFSLELYEEALANTKDMIVLFNDPVDWRNLRAVQSRLGIDNTQEDNQPDLGSLEPESLQSRNAETIAATTSLDSGYLPVVVIQPPYPEHAAREGIEGWVLVSFTVDEDGRVAHESIKVVDSAPEFTFNQAAIRAAQNLVYNPRIQDGAPISVDDVQYLFRWSLNRDA